MATMGDFHRPCPTEDSELCFVAKPDLRHIVLMPTTRSTGSSHTDSLRLIVRRALGPPRIRPCSEILGRFVGGPRRPGSHVRPARGNGVPHRFQAVSPLVAHGERDHRQRMALTASPGQDRAQFCGSSGCNLRGARRTRPYRATTLETCKACNAARDPDADTRGLVRRSPAAERYPVGFTGGFCCVECCFAGPVPEFELRETVFVMIRMAARRVIRSVTKGGASRLPAGLAAGAVPGGLVVWRRVWCRGVPSRGGRQGASLKWL